MARKEVYRGKLQTGSDVRTLSDEAKKRIHKRDNYTCQYCQDESECIDHIIPWCYDHNNSDDNLVASCNVCNLIAGSKVFDNFDEKKFYFLTKIRKISRGAEVKIWTRSELKEIGPNLRKYISSNVVVVDTEEEKKHVYYRVGKKANYCLKYIEEYFNATD